MKKKLLLWAVMLICCVTGMATERPKLVVGLVVDQMRWDYLYYYCDRFGEGGLKRLLDEGFSCENTQINYLPTVTAIGHTSIYTGSTPSQHGICGNNFMEKGRDRYCCGDETVKGVGTDDSAGQMSPRNMLANTIGDQLKLATDFQAKVIGVALKDRAAILPAGHAADAAYWFDKSVGHFITSTYYMKQLPDWVKRFNKENQTKPGEDMKMKPEGVTLTFKMAEAVLENEQMGRHDVTDLLAVSISSTDAISHEYGTRADITKEAYRQLDRAMAHFFQTLDEKVGKGQWLLFLSADHGGAHAPQYMRQHKLPAGGWDGNALFNAANKRLAEKYGVEKLLCGKYGDFIYIDHAKVRQAGISLEDVKRETIDEFMTCDTLLYVVDCARAATAPIPQLIRERIVNGYNRLRTGDLFCLPRPQMFSWAFSDSYRGTTHSEWNPYDAHIPLVFMGWHVSHGETNLPTRIVDIAPTVCAMLHIQAPNACIGDPILSLTH